jgi:hypothetical protein
VESGEYVIQRRVAIQQHTSKNNNSSSSKQRVCWSCNKQGSCGGGSVRGDASPLCCRRRCCFWKIAKEE